MACDGTSCIVFGNPGFPADARNQGGIEKSLTNWAAAAGEKDLNQFGRLAIEQGWLIRSLALPRGYGFSDHAINRLGKGEPRLLDGNLQEANSILWQDFVCAGDHDVIALPADTANA